MEISICLSPFLLMNNFSQTSHLCFFYISRITLIDYLCIQIENAQQMHSDAL